MSDHRRSLKARPWGSVSASGTYVPKAGTHAMSRTGRNSTQGSIARVTRLWLFLFQALRPLVGLVSWFQRYQIRKTGSGAAQAAATSSATAGSTRTAVHRKSLTSRKAVAQKTGRRGGKGKQGVTQRHNGGANAPKRCVTWSAERRTYGRVRNERPSSRGRTRWSGWCRASTTGPPPTCDETTGAGSGFTANTQR